MSLKKESHADYVGRAAYAHARAAAAADRREKRDWLTIASEWMAMAEAFRRLEELNGSSRPAEPKAAAE